MEDLNRLRCPNCRGGIEPGVAPDEVRCAVCASRFGVAGGVIVLLPDTLGAIERAEVRYWDERGQREAEGLDPFFDDNYPARDRYGMYHYLRDLRSVAKHDPILEVGCGLVPKSLYLALFEGYQDVTVSDISSVQLVENRRLCERKGIAGRVAHVAADAATLPFADGIFAAVMVHAALHHVPEPTAALREMARCLRPGGLIVVGHEPNRSVHRVIRRIGDGVRLTEKHRRQTYSEADEETDGLSAKELTRELREMGFTPVAMVPHWLVMGLFAGGRGVIRNLTGKHPRVLDRLRGPVRALDGALGRVPLVRNGGFHFSLVMRKASGAGSMAGGSRDLSG